MTCCSDTIQLVFVFILVPLLTAYVPYSSSLRGSTGPEKPCIQEACAVDNRPVYMPYEGSQETDR